MTGASEATVVQWFQWFRESCSHWLVNHCEKIGGPGVIVQIDESLIVKSKYGRGHELEQRWVFGGYCPSQKKKKGFLQFVQNRKL